MGMLTRSRGCALRSRVTASQAYTALIEKMNYPEDQFRHDQIVPIADSALLSAKIIKNATLNVYKGASHGMCTTQKDQVNADLLAFFQGVS